MKDRRGRARWVELAPMLLVMFLLGFVADLAVRRWENLLGCLEWGRGWSGQRVVVAIRVDGQNEAPFGTKNDRSQSQSS